MRRATGIATAAAALLVAVSGAQAKPPKAGLPVGPNTVAGPLALELDPGIGDPIWESDEAMNVCLTLVVTRGTNVDASVSDPPFANNRVIHLSAGESGMVCLEGADAAYVGCPSSSPDCRVVWRLDVF